MLKKGQSNQMSSSLFCTTEQQCSKGYARYIFVSTIDICVDTVLISKRFFIVFFSFFFFFFFVVLDFSDLRQFGINGFPEVVEGGRPQNDPSKPAQTRPREEPEKQAVQYHGDKLPVLDFLEKKKWREKKERKLFEFNLRRFEENLACKYE